MSKPIVHSETWQIEDEEGWWLRVTARDTGDHLTVEMGISMEEPQSVVVLGAEGAVALAAAAFGAQRFLAAMADE